jgi:hypothetical protein
MYKDLTTIPQKRWQIIRIRVELGANNALRTLDWGGRRIDVVEMIDQWYGADYRYVKVKGSDGGIYMLRFDEIRDEWALIMFVSARGRVLMARAA